jgi:hypothetical protein
MAKNEIPTDLLSVARSVLLDEILEFVPDHKKYEALMIANAMAISSREEVLGKLDKPSLEFLDALSETLGQTNIQVETSIEIMRLAEFSTGSLKAIKLQQVLILEAERKVKISNPHYLK